MVGILIRMQLALIGHSMSGAKAFWMAAGAAIGVILGLGAIVLSLMRGGHPTVVADLLAIVYLVWTAGWIIGPMWGGSAVLRAEHFAMLAIPRWRLATGMLVASFVGIGAAVTLVAFISLIGYAARLGTLPLLMSIPAVALQLLCVVLLSKAAAAVFTRAARGRVGAALNGVMLAVVLVLSQSGWMVVIGFIVSGVWENGFPAAFSTALRLMPSGWGLVAVEAVHDRRWWLALAAVAAMVALAAALLSVWARTLEQPRGGRPVIRGSRQVRTPRWLGANPTGAVLRKELRAWWRDPARLGAIVGPLAWGTGTALLPLTFGETLLLPWAAPLIALMAATFMANLYAFDGTALWLTLQTGTERQDLRARQYAYLLVFAPVTLVAAVVFTAWSAQAWVWPWVLAIVPALLGGGAGLVVLISVVALEPGPDPHHRAENPLDASEGIGPAFLVFLLALLPPLPAVAVLAAGTVMDHAALRWAAVPIGIATGAVLAWWLGRIAARRLQTHGPELLWLIRSGHPSVVSDKDPDVEGPAPNVVVQTLGWTLGSIAVFPQGLVPILFKLTGNTEVRVWFLAMYLPEPLGWATAIAMIFLGAYFYRMAIIDLRRPMPRPAA